MRPGFRVYLWKTTLTRNCGTRSAVGNVCNFGRSLFTNVLADSLGSDFTRSAYLVICVPRHIYSTSFPSPSPHKCRSQLLSQRGAFYLPDCTSLSYHPIQFPICWPITPLHYLPPCLPGEDSRQIPQTCCHPVPPRYVL